MRDALAHASFIGSRYAAEPDRQNTRAVFVDYIRQISTFSRRSRTGRPCDHYESRLARLDWTSGAAEARRRVEEVTEGRNRARSGGDNGAQLEGAGRAEKRIRLIAQTGQPLRAAVGRRWTVRRWSSA
jgi:hypothetical protein